MKDYQHNSNNFNFKVGDVVVHKSNTIFKMVIFREWKGSYWCRWLNEKGIMQSAKFLGAELMIPNEQETEEDEELA